MKFSAGDCISFKIGKNGYLAGFLSSVARGRYEFALTDYCSSTPPPEQHFQNCQVFSLKYELETRTMSMLDILILDPVQVDTQPEITKIYHIALHGPVAAAEFKEISYSSLAIQDYFNSGLALRHRSTGDIDPTSRTFGTRCLIPLAEFISKIPPVNQFTTIKLYIDKQGELYYWQIYGSSHEPVFLVIHWGKLGETGEFKEIRGKTVAEITKIYEPEIVAKKNEGYTERQDRARMILQFRTSHGWGDNDDLGFRNEISEELNKYLFWTGNGSTTGGDVGAGTVNIFFETVDPQKAVQTIVQLLKEKMIEQPYFIALEHDPESNELSDEEYAVKVLYPSDFEGEFNY